METLANVIEYMKQKKVNPLRVDTWGSSKEETKIFSILKNVYKNNKVIEIDNYKILIDFTKGGGSGMGEHPDEYKISILLKF